MLAGKTAIKVLSKDSNNEFIFLILAVLFGSYCMIGGLGTTFYISYFNTALTFVAISVFIIYTSFYPSTTIEKVSTIESMYHAVTCLKGPDGNFQNSYLTFRSKSGLIYGVVIIFMATSISFCDQANWQSRIAAKPSQGVIGFFFAAYMWFVVPTAMSFTTTMTYFAMSYENGTHLLSDAEIDNGKTCEPFIK
jgi:Na+/proline symporter